MKTPFVRTWVWLFLVVMIGLSAGFFLYIDQHLPKEDRFFSQNPAARKANSASTVPPTVERDLAHLLPRLAAEATPSA